MTFADNKWNVNEMTIIVCESVENIVGKGESAGFKHFLLFPPHFPEPSSLGSLKLKVRIVW